MPFCAYCGKPYEGSPKFCAFCGRPLGQAQTPAPTGGPAPVPPPPQAPPPQAPPAYAYAPTVPMAAVPPRKRSLKWLWVGLAALVVVVAVVLVLVLVVFGGENGSDEGGMTAPEKAVAQFFEALENKDIDKIFDLVDPTIFGVLPEGMDKEAIKEMLKATMFAFGEMKFKDIKMSTQMTSDTTATVTIVEGSVTVKMPDGTVQTEDVSEAGEPVTIDLVKVDGKWYMKSTPFMGD